MRSKVLKLIDPISKGLVITFYLILFITIYFDYFHQGEMPNFLYSIKFPIFLILILILVSIFISVKDKISKIVNFSLLITFEEFYPTVPFFIMGIGSTVFLAGLYLYPILFNLGVILIILGLLLFVLLFFVKKSLEQRIYFNLIKANRILNEIESNNNIPIYIYSLKKYMNLIFKNINNKLGRELDLKTCNETDDSSKLTDILVNYLPYYIKFGDEEQLNSAKTHLQAMLNSVNEEDKINWREFTTAALNLKKEITTYLENNFNVVPQTKREGLDWVYKNRNMIIQSVGYIIPIIIYLLKKIP